MPTFFHSVFTFGSIDMAYFSTQAKSMGIFDFIIMVITSQVVLFWGLVLDQ